MIFRTVNLSPNYGKWDDYSRRELLNAWRNHYYQNTINMSPIEGHLQGGQGYFDSQIYFSSLDYSSFKNLSPSDEKHPVNIAFKKRQQELEIEFNKSSQADKERLSNLIEVEKDAHDFWQKNELFSKVLENDEHGNPYPKELVDEIRSERNLSQENFRCSMEDLINYDSAYRHPLSEPNRDYNTAPVTDKEREIWCNRTSSQGIKREYFDENGINQENKILKEKENINHSAYWGHPKPIGEINRIPQSAQKFYDNYSPSYKHNNDKNIDSGLFSNRKETRTDGLKVSEIEEKIKNHNTSKKEIVSLISDVESIPSIEQRDERIQNAQEKVKEVIPENKEFKVMPEMSKEKGYFTAWIDRVKEKVLDFKEKALNLWEDRVAPKLGIETEKSRKEAYQESIDKINLKEIRDFERKIKAEENEKSQKKHKPKGESNIEIDSSNKQNINENNEVKKRRPSSGVSDESSHINSTNNDIEEVKHKPTGESSKQEYSEVNDNRYTRKIK